MTMRSTVPLSRSSRRKSEKVISCVSWRCGIIWKARTAAVEAGNATYAAEGGVGPASPMPPPPPGAAPPPPPLPELLLLLLPELLPLPPELLLPLPKRLLVPELLLPGLLLLPPPEPLLLPAAWPLLSAPLELPASASTFFASPPFLKNDPKPL